MPVKSADWSFDGTETDPTNIQLRKPGGEALSGELLWSAYLKAGKNYLQPSLNEPGEWA